MTVSAEMRTGDTVNGAAEQPLLKHQCAQAYPGRAQL